MEVSTICGSFIYGEGQEELVNRGRYKAKKEKKRKKDKKRKPEKMLDLFYSRIKRTTQNTLTSEVLQFLSKKSWPCTWLKRSYCSWKFQLFAVLLFMARDTKNASVEWGGRVQKCILKYFSLVSEEKMEAVTIPIKKNTFKPMSSEKRRQSCSAIDRRLNRSRPERKADGRWPSATHALC